MKQSLYALLTAWLILFFSACSSSPKTPEEMETEFLERFKVFIQEGGLSKGNIEEVWMVGDTPESEISRTISEFKKIKEQGIGETRFHEIYPKMLEGMSEPFELGGEHYLPNLEPYKMVEIIYSNAIEVEHGKENGWSMVVGESQGKLYLMGYQRQIQSQ